MNKKGDKLISVYWFAILFIVAGGIVYMTVSFYGAPKDIRGIEANVLTNKVADCLAQGGYIREEVLNEESGFRENFLKECSLNFAVENVYGWREQEQYYVNVAFHEFDDNSPDNFGEKFFEISAGNVNLKTMSFLEKPTERLATKRNSIVIHYTEGFSAKDAIDAIRDARLSIHYLIDRDGTIISRDNEDFFSSIEFFGLGRRAFVSESVNAQHSGCYDVRERFRRPDCSAKIPDCLDARNLLKQECRSYSPFMNNNKLCCIEGFNTRAIGIELVNLGDLCRHFMSACEMRGGVFYEDGVAWEKFTDEQINSLVNLVADIVSRYDIHADRNHIIGHEEITNFKSDPGPAFPWEYFIQRVNEQKRLAPGLGRNFYSLDKEGNQYAIKILSIVRKTEKNEA